MIIGFDGSRAFNTKRTGTENYSYQILTHLAKIDRINQYKVYLRPPADLKDIQSSYDWPDNFKFLILNFKFLWTQFGLAKQTFQDKIDVLFIPSHTLPLIRKPGLKTVVTVHDLGAEYLPQTHQLKQRLYLKLMIDYQLKSATHLIVVSQTTRDDLIKKVGIPANKISVVYEGYNEKLFKPIKNDTLRDTLKYYNLQPNNYHLFIGTIQPRKNLARLIQAYRSFLSEGWRAWGTPIECPQGVKRPRTSDGGNARQDPKPKLVLVGSKGWLADEIYKLPKQLEIEEYVKFLGYVPDEKLPVLYSGAIAFLFPSLFEGFGLPILEAFACHCPVLTSNISSMPEVAGKAAILVDPYNKTDIAHGITELTMNRELTNQLTKLGQKQMKKFSWEKAAKETLTVIKSLK